jgi:hypothetical protein
VVVSLVYILCTRVEPVSLFNELLLKKKKKLLNLNYRLDHVIVYSQKMCINSKVMIRCRELMHNEGLREEQIVAAEKVMRLLYPSERITNNLSQQDSRLRFPHFTPSMVAASTILYYVKP